MRLHEFPITDESWNEYLRGVHYGQTVDAEEGRQLPVVNYLALLHSASTRWPNASETDRLRWMLLHMQDVVNALVAAHERALAVRSPITVSPTVTPGAG